MAQYFDDVKISDKGMIKLIRNNGSDYIIPASQLIQVNRQRPPDNPNSWHPIARSIAGLFDSDAFKDTRVDTVCIVTKKDYFYVNIPYTDDLYRRLDDAHTISTNIEEKKNGVFR
jgi:hypothetical protein